MRHRHSPGIRGQLMWFLCCICLFLLALVWFLSTQLLEPLYTKHIEKQLTTQAENITADLDKALAEGETLSSWSFGRLSVNTSFFDRLATQLYASGSLNSFCVDISDSTMRTIYKIENQSYCNLHETLLSDSANNDMIVSTAVAMRKKCRTTGGFVQTLNPPRLSGSAQLLVGRNTAGGEYTVLVTTSLVHVAEAGKILSTVLPMAAAVIFAFAMTAGWLFSEWFTKPLRQLSSAARQMAMGNYAVQVDTRRSDELGDLAQDFNHMANEVQRSSQMQRDLLANVSHDLRTPLTMMKAYAEMIRDLSGNNPVKREQHLNIIIEETDRLTQIVNDMLDLSKLESGAQKLDYSTFDIAQCMAEIVHRYEGVSERMGYQIHLTLDEPCMVRCDESKIDRVIGNLINNAINYTSKEDKQVFVTQRNLPQCVRIEVRDTGDGIEEDKIKLIFDKYYRSENHKREVVGTGLGLSIVKEILKMHNYNYGVNSKLGEGSTFWFEIRDIVPPEKPEDEEIPDAEIRQL